MITIKNDGNTNIYYGLSTDVKPAADGLNASKFVEMDTKKTYLYDEENEEWLEQ